MSGLDEKEVQRHLDAWNRQDDGAPEQLISLLYEELRELAGRVMARERQDHTLSATEVLHSAYEKIVRQRGKHLERREHFIALWALCMRRVLIDHARKKKRPKQGGDLLRVTLTVGENRVQHKEYSLENLLALDDAMTALGRLPDQQGEVPLRIVELRYFGGFSMQEIAVELEVSLVTVTRGWRFARAWLHNQLGGDGRPD